MARETFDCLGAGRMAIEYATAMSFELERNRLLSNKGGEVALMAQLLVRYGRILLPGLYWEDNCCNRLLPSRRQRV